MYRFIGMIFVLTTAAIAQSGNNQISGVITYYDQNQQTNVPLKNAHVALETQYPIILQGNNEYPSTYSDDNGYYSFNVGVLEPEIVTIRLYFSNEYIQVQSRGGTRSTSESVVFMTGWPNCTPTPPATECSKILIIDINFDNQTDEAEYATILSMGTYAAQFAVARGIQVATPAKIKYPAEECFVDNVSFVVESAFFWPFGDWTTNDFGFWGSVIGFFDHTGSLTENTIYLPNAYAANGYQTTIFHEYAHFLMKIRRNDIWPISLNEYMVVEEQTHTWVDYDQSPRLAFIEGWANYFGSAVEGDFAGNSYSGKYGGYSSIFEYPSNYNLSYPYFTFNSITDGYLNEVTVGAAFFDLYDPATGGDADGYEGSLSEIAAVMALGDNYFSSYMSSYFNQADMDDHDAIANILTTLKMELPSDIYLTLSNLSITTTETYEATNSITVGPAVTVESGGDLTLSAGNSIRLLPGFHAKAGSQFVAKVGYVPPTPQPPTAPGGLYIVNETSLGGNPVLQWSASTGDPTISYSVYRCDRTIVNGQVQGSCASEDYVPKDTGTNTTFTDNEVIIADPETAGYLHDYYVVASNSAGTSGQSNHVDINGGGIIPVKSIPIVIPEVYSLSRGYPNPFNPTVTIPFGLPETSTALLVVYDITGREVTRLVDGTMSAGYHQVIWNGRTATGLSVASGIYIYRLVATSVASGEHFIATKKIVFLK